jgi:hypothetical protein
MDSSEFNIQCPIKDMAYLQKLLKKGYIIEGPKKKVTKDLLVFKKILKRGYDFIPEGWLASKGYEFVEPCTLTKGFKLAYIIKNDVLIQFFRSNYSLCKKNNKIPLYLKVVDKVA